MVYTTKERERHDEKLYIQYTLQPRVVCTPYAGGMRLQPQIENPIKQIESVSKCIECIGILLMREKKKKRVYV